MTKFALKVSRVLFTDDEIINGMVGPIDRVKTKGKKILHESRVDLLKSDNS